MCDSEIYATPDVMRLVDDLTVAYLQCRSNKRNKRSAQEFELGWAVRIYELAELVASRNYKPLPSIAFLVRRPLLREIFAAAFRDRIIHFYIAIRLEPLFEQLFIDDTYNCRKGRGSLFGIQQVHEMIRECSCNYTQDCYVGKFDFRGFFMSIHLPTLWQMLKLFILDNYRGDDREILLYLTEIVVFNRPQNNCIFHSPLHAWKRLARAKSLFFAGDDYGLPIGNLTSQIFANFFLTAFDVALKVLFEFYGRYVDDFTVVDELKENILKSIPLFRLIAVAFHLKLHPNKIYIQHYSKGLKFVGAVIKKERTYVSNRCVRNFEDMMFEMAMNDNKEERAAEFVSRANSYLGYMIHHASYAIRRRIIEAMNEEWWKYVYVGGHFEKLVLRNEFSEKSKINCRISNLKSYD